MQLPLFCLIFPHICFCVSIRVFIFNWRSLTIDYYSCIDVSQEAQIGGHAQQVRKDPDQDQVSLPPQSHQGRLLHQRRTLSLTQSATIFTINYSTAKTLMRQFKSQPSSLDLDAIPDLTPIGHAELKRCTYLEIRCD